MANLKNGNKRSRGKPFTSETAREARLKRAVKERNEASVVEEIKKLMSQEFTDANGKKKTGAEIIASAIMQNSIKGNSKMTELLLKLIGENPDLIKSNVDEGVKIVDDL